MSLLQNLKVKLMAVGSETLVGKFHNDLFSTGCMVVLMEL
jgi:hypothetical protein